MKIEGYENYEVYENGDVVNTKTGRKLKNDVCNSGYKRVVVCKNNKPKRFLVHRLVAEYYVKNPENKEYVNHINGEKFDNSAENLEWVTQSENQIHAYEMGLQPANKKGWEHVKSKLTKEQVDEIRALYVPGKKPTHQTIAGMYGVARQTITDLLAGKIYRLDEDL